PAYRSFGGTRLWGRGAGIGRDAAPGRDARRAHLGPVRRRGGEGIHLHLYPARAEARRCPTTIAGPAVFRTNDSPADLPARRPWATSSPPGDLRLPHHRTGVGRNIRLARHPPRSAPRRGVVGSGADLRSGL